MIDGCDVIEMWMDVDFVLACAWFVWACAFAVTVFGLRALVDVLNDFRLFWRGY